MPISFDRMTASDYPEVAALWEASPGVGLSPSDSREGVSRFLDRNPSLSFVARDRGRLVGAVLCGHDGRRGYISHLAVARSHRRRGVGRSLVEHALRALVDERIDKCHIFVFAENDDAMAFWKSEGWTERVELVVLSRFVERGTETQT